MPRLISPSPRLRVEPRIAPRALPRSLMAIYYLDENRFREMVERLEKDGTLTKLIERGLVERVRFQGKVPQHRYEEYKDEELVAFFKRFPITEHPDWQADFLSPGAVARRHALARKYRVPLGPLTSVLRYLSYASALQDCSARSFNFQTRSEEPDFLTFTASPELYDTSPHVETVRRFVERSGLSAQEFSSLFLACKPDPEAILRRVSCPEEEVFAALAALDKIQVLNSLHFDMRDSRGPSRAEKSRGTVVAEVVSGQGNLDLELRLLGDRIYDVKYRLHTEQPGLHLNARERELIEQLRAVNQRKTVLCRIVSCLFRRQYRYLLSGDCLHMAPLTQAQVARELQEEEATVSRLARDKLIVTPQGEFPLRKLFRKVADLVHDLIVLREAAELAAGKRREPYTDSELQRILEHEYGVRLSRRAVTYHRNRTKAGCNFYTRSRRVPARQVQP
ncbi:MAG: hypothetical protein HY814_08275 [Candidatus Riflebacteria bacterium]|nr:hypothetical protein [Candidatus Riflebacteria bacterium]